MEYILVDVLEAIWKSSIADAYLNGLICSERLLQAELYRQLKNQTNYQIWIEPDIHLKNNPVLHHKKPDIIITDQNNIVGVMELKYNLQTGIGINWDIEKLTEFSRLKNYTEGIPLKTDLKNGNWDFNNTFSVSKDLVLVLAVIAWKGTEALDTVSLKNKLEIRSDVNLYHLIGEVDEPFDKNGFRLQKI